MNEYAYTELEAAALKPGATQEEINALGEWFQQYGHSFWNGSSWLVKEDLRLAPIYKEIEEDEYEIIGYTFANEPVFEEG